MTVTQTVLAELAARQEALGSELNSSGLTSFVERAEWLAEHRTVDEQLAWERRWEALGVEPEVESKGSYLLGELEWLLSNGATAWECEAALGSKRRSLETLAYRHGRPDLAVKVAPPNAERKAA